ncbi:hypothetical protein F5Y14DRAFT_280678 [Nemania sp. NC0429]|nr:hypothetical protein F5Y14DRAFT_280678 [Nemania sp. NC0429]
MPTAFICCHCSARLARYAFRSTIVANQSLLHTRIIPAKRSWNALVPPARHGLGPTREFSQSKRSSAIAERISSDIPTASPLLYTLPERQDSKTRVTAPEKAVGLKGSRVNARAIASRLAHARRVRATKKIVRIIGPYVNALASFPLARSTRNLKSSILATRADYRRIRKSRTTVAIYGLSHSNTRGAYRTIREDLAAVYGLSYFEARHAEGQVRRLLRGDVEKETAASQVDRYLSWKRAFAGFLRKLSTLAPNEESEPGTHDTEPETISDESKTELMRTAWQRADRNQRERGWPRMLLSALESEPHILPTLIQATFDPSWCPSYVVEDIIYILHRRHQVALRNGDLDNCGRIGQDLEAIVAFVLKNCPSGYLVLEQPALQLMLSSLPAAELSRRLQLLSSMDHPLHENTLLHVASLLAKSSDTKEHAIKVLRMLTETPGFDINAPAPASVCTSLLTLNENEPLPSEEAAPDLLFRFLLELGLRPNLIGLSALMRNFCVRGRLDTAWKIFDLMLQYRLEPDQHVYSILLNASKTHLDSDSLARIFDIIASRNKWSPILLNDFLDLLFRENEAQIEGRRRQRKTASNSWALLFQLYAKFFELAPLQKFTLLSLEDLVGRRAVRPKYSTYATGLAESLMPRPEPMLMQPDSTTLCLMIASHMRSQATPIRVVRSYLHFCGLVDKKDPTALDLLATHGTLMYDIYIRALMQFQNAIRFALRIAQDMIEAAHKEKAQDGRNSHHHPPSAHTWTIILNGFKNHRDLRSVVSILDMMVSTHNVAPTLATWNALIQAFAQAGNVNGVVKAIQSLEEAGLKADDRTTRAFSMLPKNQHQHALAQLDMMREAPEQYLKARAPTWDYLSPTSPLSRLPQTLGELAREQRVAIRRKTANHHGTHMTQQPNSSTPIGPPRGAEGRRILNMDKHLVSADRPVYHRIV